MLRNFPRFLFLLIGLLGSENAFSIQPVPFGFFKYQPDRLVFSTAAQSIYAGNCSGITTVQYRTGSGAAKNVAADLTVSLTVVANVTYFSDANCTNSITSIVIASGTSSASFYYISDTTGTKNLAVTTVSGLETSQNQTIGTNPFVWTGGGANANWNTAANWSGGAAPTTTSHIALFNGTCSSNCSPTINASFSIGGVRMASDYTGTITQNAGISFSIGSGGWSQLAGTFVGGDSAVSMTGPMGLTGGTYTASSNVLTITSRNWNVSGTATFNNGGGGVYLGTTSAVKVTMASAHFNNLTFDTCSGSFDLGGGTIHVDGTLKYVGGCSLANVESGTVMAYGNVTHSLQGGGGSAILKIAGNIGGQTITGVGTSASFPNMIIDAGANNVTFSGDMTLRGNYAVASVGTLTTTGSTIQFATGAAHTIAPGAHHYNNITFNTCGGSFDLGGATMHVDGTLIFSGGCSIAYVYSGTLMAYGDIQNTNSGGGGDVLVKLAGNASGQTITGAGSGSYFPAITIDAGTNAVTFSGTIFINGTYNFVSAGSLTATGSTVIFNTGSGPARTIVPGPYHYNNVTFTNCGGSFDLGGNSFLIDGTLSFSPGCGAVSVNSGILMAYGNVTTSGGGGYGSVELQFVGPGNRTVTATGGTLPSGNVTVATTGGGVVSLGSAISWNNAGQTTTLTSGSINMAGYALTVKALSLNSNTVVKTGGTLTVNGAVAGTGALFGGTVDP